MAVLTKDDDALGGGRRERCLPSLEAPALALGGLGAACILAAVLWRSV